jgi:hypothetical protein
MWIDNQTQAQSLQCLFILYTLCKDIQIRNINYYVHITYQHCN